MMARFMFFYASLAFEAVGLWDEYHPGGWSGVSNGACPKQCKETDVSGIYNRPFSYKHSGPNITGEVVGQIVKSTTQIQYEAIALPGHLEDQEAHHPGRDHPFEGCQHQPKCFEYVWNKSEASYNGNGLGSVITVVCGAVVGALAMGLLLDTDRISNRWCLILITLCITIGFGFLDCWIKSTVSWPQLLLIGIGIGAAYPGSVATAIAMTKLRVEGWTILMEVSIVFALQGIAKILMQLMFQLIQNFVLPTHYWKACVLVCFTIPGLLAALIGFVYLDEDYTHHGKQEEGEEKPSVIAVLNEAYDNLLPLLSFGACWFTLDMIKYCFLDLKSYHQPLMRCPYIGEGSLGRFQLFTSTNWAGKLTICVTPIVSLILGSKSYEHIFGIHILNFFQILGFGIMGCMSLLLVFLVQDTVEQGTRNPTDLGYSLFVVFGAVTLWFPDITQFLLSAKAVCLGQKATSTFFGIMAAVGKTGAIVGFLIREVGCDNDSNQIEDWDEDLAYARGVYFFCTAACAWSIYMTMTNVWGPWRATHYEVLAAQMDPSFNVGLLMDNVDHKQGSTSGINWNLDMRQIGLESKLAAGAAGQVWLGYFQGSQVAIKEIFSTILATQDDQAMNEFHAETTILQSLKHPNVITFYGVAADSDHCYIVMELMQKSLRDVLLMRTVGGMTLEFQMQDILNIATQVAAGMSYMHYKGIIHYDLKPENVMLNTNRGFTCKICDFGTSKFKKARIKQDLGERRSTFGSIMGAEGDESSDDDDDGALGTLLYMPPEKLVGYSWDGHVDSPNSLSIRRSEGSMRIRAAELPEGHSKLDAEKSYDVYSMGVLMWELINLDELYGEIQEQLLIDEVVRGIRPDAKNCREDETQDPRDAEGSRLGLGVGTSTTRQSIRQSIRTSRDSRASSVGIRMERLQEQTSSILEECWAHHTWHRPRFEELRKRLSDQYSQVVKLLEEDGRAREAHKRGLEETRKHRRKFAQHDHRTGPREVESSQSGLGFQPPSFQRTATSIGSSTADSQYTQDMESRRKTRSWNNKSSAPPGFPTVQEEEELPVDRGGAHTRKLSSMLAATGEQAGMRRSESQILRQMQQDQPSHLRASFSEGSPTGPAGEGVSPASEGEGMGIDAGMRVTL